MAAFAFQVPVGMLPFDMGPADMAEPVTGAPYSATIVTEMIQPLADGNRIEHRWSSSVARDGEGRVRTEQRIAPPGATLPDANVHVVRIMDPVAGVHVSLDATRRVAFHTALSQLPVFGGHVAQGGAVAAFAGAPPGTFRQDGRSEELGTRQIEGLAAEGSRTVVTIPAGAIGNVAPIEIVTERWYSPDLRIVVLSRHADPRVGETTYRVEDVVLGEPSPDMFQVPADYTTQRMPSFPAVAGPSMPRP